jgi:hypothetical protein
MLRLPSGYNCSLVSCLCYRTARPKDSRHFDPAGWRSSHFAIKRLSKLNDFSIILADMLLDPCFGKFCVSSSREMMVTKPA